MFLNSLDRKPLFKKRDGNIVRDLTQTMFDFKANNYINYSVYRVPTDYEMRPDLIAQSVYNNTIYAEYILKYNGISNPFSIDKGDIILIPSLETARQNTKKQGEGAEDSDSKRIRNSYKYIDPAKAPRRDKDIEKFDQRNLGKKDSQLADGALPPNIAQEGETGITYRNGRVYFGEGIGQSACLRNGMSQSEFLTKVIKSKKV
jgi:hypothetical protein